MRYTWAMIASIGLLICAAGFAGTPDLVAYVFGNRPAANSIALIGIGGCIFAFARTWMLVTWRDGSQRHERHEPKRVVSQVAHS